MSSLETQTLTLAYLFGNYVGQKEIWLVLILFWMNQLDPKKKELKLMRRNNSDYKKLDEFTDSFKEIYYFGDPRSS